MNDFLHFPAVQDLSTESLLINEFYLTSVMKESLERHYLLHWTGTYLKSQMTPRGTIMRDEGEYLVILPTCCYKQFFASHQLKLSFRKPYDPARMAYVLVRFL